MNPTEFRNVVVSQPQPNSGETQKQRNSNKKVQRVCGTSTSNVSVTVKTFLFRLHNSQYIADKMAGPLATRSSGIVFESGL